MNVAAYARVSSGKDAMLHSLSNQVSYYNELIQSHRGWQLAGIYSDEAKTGTKDSRPGFVSLIDACRKGKIDLVITKSISRFARNTVTLLQTVRELRSLGIDVFFEEQNLHTAGTNGELIITILASYAEAEALSVSENQKWRIHKNFEEGIPWNGALLGYRLKNGRFEIVPEEAEIVKKIFRYYLEGDGVEAIMQKLNAEGLMTRFNCEWHRSSISRLLQNYTYTGNLLLQRYYNDNFITKRKTKNNGELPMYHAENTHEPIISLEDFEAVQAEMKRRADKYAAKDRTKKTYPFSGLIVCSKCGKKYRRRLAVRAPIWLCTTYCTYGKDRCPSKAIPEEKLEEMTAGLDLGCVSSITAEDGNRITIHFTDGTDSVRYWDDRSRSE